MITVSTDRTEKLNTTVKLINISVFQCPEFSFNHIDLNNEYEHFGDRCTLLTDMLTDYVRSFVTVNGPLVQT